MGPLSIEQVLAAEVIALNGVATGERGGDPRAQATEQDTQSRRMKKDADVRSGADENPDEVEKRKAFYRSLNKLNRAALSLSGGGIRSATFCLGVIQALAAYDLAPAPAEGEEKSPSLPENSLLGRFQYLSTVSGGGYIGSWLSAWRQREDFPGVWTDLIGRPDGPDAEPPELSWLRAYSNYLTPKIGLGSADTWTGIAIYLRNLILNWLVIIPAVCLVLLGLKFLAASFVGIARSDGPWIPAVMGVFGAACLIKAHAFTTSHRPTRREAPDTEPSPHNVVQSVFLKNGLLWSLLSSMGVAIALVSHSGINGIDFVSSHAAMSVADGGRAAVILSLALIGALIFALGWIFGRPVRRSVRDFWLWTSSGAVYGMFLGLGVILFMLLGPYASTDDNIALRLLLPMTFGVPWVLVSQLAAEMVFVGLVSYESESDSDREWLGRSAGWEMAAAIAWMLLAALSIALGYYIQESYHQLGTYFASLGSVTGIATALIGKSSKTSASDAEEQTTTSQILNYALAIAGPVFVAILIVLLSIALDQLLLRTSFVTALDAKSIHAQSIPHILLWLAIGGIVAGAIGTIASKNVNINRFSLHAVYRNRLVRCYLGASRQKRNPDHFTGFDERDNPCAHTLWPPKPTAAGPNTFGLFHLVNIALNVVETKRLAWQERKAEPFTVSPLHCGSADKGFRISREYGGQGGLTLGTAMAISGAAVSPNMGYHSSPSITLLLALFNVRLGWWLGNPGTQGEQSYQTEGPSFAINPLIEEAFGQTTDNRPYVYLSDGGHFENLGLYEMVRRRCRFIVVVDAGCDPDFAFEDLGNAVRKIYIDLGIRVRFDQLQSIKNRPSAGIDEERRKIPYYTIGLIDYKDADGAEEGCEDGIILYIKPAYHGTEGAGIVSYATAHKTFPHETTTDQWFTESQFESYRSLGLEITNTILQNPVAVRNGLTLQQLLAKLPATTRA
jgi:Patatin-like phospholipase